MSKVTLPPKGSKVAISSNRLQAIFKVYDKIFYIIQSRLFLFPFFLFLQAVREKELFFFLFGLSSNLSGSHGIGKIIIYTPWELT